MLKLTRWTIAHRRIVVVAWIVLAVGVHYHHSLTGHLVFNVRKSNSDCSLVAQVPSQSEDLNLCDPFISR